jgi:hypothetical protein
MDRTTSQPTIIEMNPVTANAVNLEVHAESSNKYQERLCYLLYFPCLWPIFAISLIIWLIFILPCKGGCKPSDDRSTIYGEGDDGE